MVDARVYVQPLNAYNSNKAAGDWVEVTDDPDELMDAIQEVLDASPVPEEEWAFHDYDGILSDFELGEYESVETLAKLVELSEEFDAGAIAAYYSNIDDDLDRLAENFEDSYAGEWKDEEDYAWDYLESTGMLSEMPEQLRAYFDAEAFARDLFISDMSSYPAPGGGIYAFYNR